MATTSDAQFVSWIRSAAPYFHAFRGRTFVVAFGGELVDQGKFASLAHDLNLLHSAGIRVVVVHGSRPQIESQLKQRKARSKYKDGVRITDGVALECVKEAVGLLRVEIDALLSQGLPNSPMAGAAINTVSGNFITAQPYGIRNGTDFQYTGTVRKVDAQAIRACLDCGNIVIVSNVGYSPTGEVFNCTVEDVAVATAKALAADKLVYFTDLPVQDKRGKVLAEISAAEAGRLLASANNLSDDTRLFMQHAVEAVRGGVPRAHLVSHQVEVSLLIELFTHKGSGSMITADKLEKLRGATIDDVGGILSLIEPLEAEGVLVYRGRELIEREIQRFHVVEHDGMIVGSAALYPFPSGKAAELAALVVSPEARGAGVGEKLVDHISREAKKRGLKKLFVLTTQAAHWFIERGFAEGDVSVLPEPRRSLYNYQRRSKVLIKNL
jgi:amino-acid N-acetyltransferase